ncbi:hypothetical protein ACI48D_19130 [Massilia sp. LXY-6]|uniref:hypothetical protein n=1 Tax=Massilia sp. LXY-6 TaxID=3379823 RepID=UPI003EE26A38
MCRSRYAQSLLAVAVLLVPIDAAPGQEVWRGAAQGVSGPPLLALLAAGLALRLARGQGSVRRPVRRRPG